MPIMSSIAGVSLRAFGFAWGALTSIFDNWVSGTPRSLGTSTSGQAWTVVQGSWTASGGGTATTSTSPSSYPLATVPLHQNVQASIQNASPGSGLVFWETDAGDWWASIVNATTATVQTGTGETYSSCATGSNTCVPSNSCVNTCNYLTYTTTTVDSCINAGGQPGSGSSCNGTSGNCAFTVTNGANGTCCGTYASQCCTGSNTCQGGYLYYPTYSTYYYWGIAFIQSVASAISTIASATLATLSTAQGATPPGAAIQSLSISINGSSVTAKAYSDTALTTPVTPTSTLSTTGTPGGTKVGIIVAPTDTSAATGSGSPYNQGNSLGQFSAH